MKEDELDRMEREAIEAIERIRLEFERAAAPYAKIVADVRALRPRVWRDDDGRVMVPITQPPDSASGSTGSPGALPQHATPAKDSAVYPEAARLPCGSDSGRDTEH